MHTVYTYSSPWSNAYSNYHHLYVAKSLKPRRLILCIWDLHVYENRQRIPQGKSREQLLKETISNMERLLKHLKVDYKIIYLSDAWNRLMARTDLMQLHQKILSTIKFSDIQKRSNLPYSFFGETTLSRINYLIVDFLIATHLHELFPEHAPSRPQVYLASERFRPFADHIVDTFHSNYRKTQPPKIEYSKFPMIFIDGWVPSIFMSDSELLKAARSVSDAKLVEDFSSIFKTQNLSCDSMAEFPEVFLEYMKRLRTLVQSGDVKETLPTLFIDSTSEFEEKIKPLNAIKLQILSLCDGSKTSYEIAQRLKLKPVTVSVYFGRLRKMGLISDDRRPKLLQRNIVVDLSSLKN